jgi:hypothetical protein
MQKTWGRYARISTQLTKPVDTSSDSHADETSGKSLENNTDRSRKINKTGLDFVKQS